MPKALESTINTSLEGIIKPFSYLAMAVGDTLPSTIPHKSRCDKQRIFLALISLLAKVLSIYSSYVQCAKLSINLQIAHSITNYFLNFH